MRRMKHKWFVISLRWQTPDMTFDCHLSYGLKNQLFPEIQYKLSWFVSYSNTFGWLCIGIFYPLSTSWTIDKTEMTDWWNPEGNGGGLGTGSTLRSQHNLTPLTLHNLTHASWEQRGVMGAAPITNTNTSTNTFTNANVMQYNTICSICSIKIKI